MQQHQNKTEELIQKYWDFVIQSTLKIPKGDWHSSGNQGYALPSQYYKDYWESDYYYNGKNRFIHYTSLHNAINIINDGFIRMNDITLLDDPQELIFAAKPFLANYNKDEFKELKRRTFSLSMCKDDNFDMWRLYGDNGRGVALVFKFFSDFGEWKGSYLSKIYYDDQEKLKVFDNLISLHDEFHTNNNILITEDFLSKQKKILSWISIFLAFHKTSFYKNENEIRLLKFDFGDIKYKTTGIAKKNDFEKAAYFKLPILTKENLEKIATERFVENLIIKEIKSIESLLDKEKIKQDIRRLYDIKNEFKNKLFDLNYEKDINLIKEVIHKNEPIILIEKILLGYRYTIDEFGKIKNSLSEHIAKKTGFKIEIEMTSLSEQFHP